ncbi:MAG: cytidine deaminase [Gemmatimonadota bacterium]|nr:cytidine deaminase [Gemmatimonadota bacterium]MDE3172110.1 cytidine deaminase [Gemmatimonadota bacterium]
MTVRPAPSKGDAEVAQTLGALRDQAARAMEAAYAPYSGFRVGAALLSADGAVAAGCNVENAAYPAGVCAERVALGAAVAQGHREFLALAIATEAQEPTPPCGVCRQALVEFAPDLVVLSVTRGGREARWTLHELLPHAFTPHSLDHSRH